MPNRHYLLRVVANGVGDFTGAGDLAGAVDLAATFTGAACFTGAGLVTTLALINGRLKAPRLTQPALIWEEDGVKKMRTQITSMIEALMGKMRSQETYDAELGRGQRCASLYLASAAVK